MRSTTFSLFGLLLLAGSICDCVSRGDTNVNTNAAGATGAATGTPGKAGSTGKGGSGSTASGESGADSGDGGTIAVNGGASSTGGSTAAASGTQGDGGEDATGPGACVAEVASPSRIAAGGVHTCAIAAAGAVKCWGNNSKGGLGNGDFQDSALPVAVSALGGIAIGVAAGSDHSCALLEGGTIKCWGGNDHGQLGIGELGDIPEPVLVPGITDAVSISAGYAHTCAVLADGAAKCWGSNSTSQIGNADAGMEDVLSPEDVLNIGAVAQIAAGESHTCAVLGDCTVRCWGAGYYGQLGNNGTGSSIAPTEVQDLAPANQRLSAVVGIGTGPNHTCAILKSGGVKCWGSNQFEQAGPAGAGGMWQVTATTVPGLAGTTHVAGAKNYTCARRSNGSVRCWGSREAGLLGDGVTDAGNTTPVVVSNLEDAAEVSVSPSAPAYAFACAIVTDGAAVCWGNGEYWQLGSGGITDQATPFAVQSFP